jgi:DNA-binding phage protein
VIRWTDLRGAVLAEMTRQEMSFDTLAAKTGLKKSTLWTALKSATDSHWGTIATILEALGLDLTWVVKTAKTSTSKRLPSKTRARKLKSR